MIIQEQCAGLRDILKKQVSKFAKHPAVIFLRKAII